MKTKKSAVILTSALLMLFIPYSFNNAISDTGRSGPDVLLIDAMKVFQELERPGVMFPHDLHTKELENRGNDCSVCHLSEDGNLVMKFARLKDIDKEVTLDIYHGKCITCHEESYEANLSTGPVECGECHVVEPKLTASQKLPSFDASLHYRHIKAGKDACDNCHHGYNEETQQKIYTKGEEESCRTCHGPETENEVVSYRLAAHQACVNCHQNTADSGPIACSGCHDAAELDKIEVVENPPRLDRNQPDSTFLKSFANMDTLMMDAVPFNHRVHENSVSSCRTCHHENLDKCEKCHSLTGKKEGNFITLPQAMHDEKSQHGCVACHAQELQEQNCRGCHVLVVNEFGRDTQDCKNCHSVSLELISSLKNDQGEVDIARIEAKAARETRTILKDVPEKIDIGTISEEYEAVFFPHRSIIDALMKGIEGNRLAKHFHQGDNIVCASCHHNSSDELLKPPNCSSCHLTSGGKEAVNIPGLKEAYHQQCFRCHDAMSIKEPASTDCIGCHEQK